MTKEIWIKAYDNVILKKRCYIAGLEAGADSVIVDDKSLLKFGEYKNVLRKNKVALVSIKKPEDMKKAEKYLGEVPRLIVELKGWNVIPIENLISESNGTSIIVLVKTAEEAELYLNALERGVDGVLIDSSDPLEIKNIIRIAKQKGHSLDQAVKDKGTSLEAITITGTRSIDSGDRVCIDTCVMLEPNEGMLVGSSSSCLFLVESETDENGYIEPRPFRVNAGALHSYIMLPDGSTGYLSELKSGDSVMIVDRDGSSHDATIGRCKIERRPMIMIEGDLNGVSCSVMLQNAETIRLMGIDGPIPVTSLRRGDKVLCRTDNGGRHCGKQVEETIQEI